MRSCNPMVLLTLSYVCLTGCDNSSSDEPSLVGDWFACRNSACTSFEDRGLRLLSGGETQMIDFEDDDIDVDTPFCAYVEKEQGLYVFDGTLLKLSLDGRPATFEAELAGDRLTLTPVDEDNEDLRVLELRRLQTKEAGCEEQTRPTVSPPQALPPMTPQGGPITPSPPTGDGPRIDGHGKPTLDAGIAPDGGITEDAGSVDAGAASDGGDRKDAAPADAATPDAAPADASTSDAAAP